MFAQALREELEFISQSINTKTRNHSPFLACQNTSIKILKSTCNSYVVCVYPRPRCFYSPWQLSQALDAHEQVSAIGSYWDKTLNTNTKGLKTKWKIS